MGNEKSFRLKLKNEDNEIKEILIKGSNTILDLKDKLCSIQSKIKREYLLIYKDNQLLGDGDRTISSYNITPLDTLSFKSSRQGEFLIFFCDGDNKVGKYVTNDDRVYDAYRKINSFFNDTSPYGFDAELFFENIKLDENSKVGDSGIKEFDKIILQKWERKG